MEHLNIPPENHVKVLGGQGWIGLIDHLGTESTIVNAARVSFGKLKSEMDERDVKLLHYLIENRHTSPLSIHCPLFVRGQWHRHRTWSYNEISRRYTEIDMEFYTPEHLRRQAESNRQASFADPEFEDTALRELIREQNMQSLALYNKLLDGGVCREQARGVLPQNMMVTFWGTVDLSNLLHFLQLRDSEHAQYEIREYAVAIRQLIAPIVPNVMAYYEKNLAGK